jgi:hypothetical protein
MFRREPLATHPYILLRNGERQQLSNYVFQSGTSWITEITMNSKYLSLSIAVFSASLFALPVAAQSTLPANVQADRATILQDQALAKDLSQQLKNDEAAGNAAAVAADRTALRLARMKTGQDFGQLRQDAQPLFQPDQAALTASLTKLLTDQQANNVGAVQMDQTAVAAAETQLRATRVAIYGDLGKGLGGSHGHRHG